LIKPTTHIALVDDHFLLRSGIVSIIQSFEGYSVLFEANNGKEFIQQLKIHPAPDLVLLDINMPEMNGIETAGWIKENLPSAKILVLSVMDTDSIIINMLKLGARGYILKDSKPGIFKQALDNIRDSGFYMNELVGNKMLNFVINDDEKAKEPAVVHNLSENEITFLQLSCTEMTYKEIAEKMKVSHRTVDGYRDHLLKKLNVQSRVGLVIFAIKYGFYKL
jgi:DNA-binding NarL/FixJ family response regulator